MGPGFEPPRDHESLNASWGFFRFCPRPFAVFRGEERARPLLSAPLEQLPFADMRQWIAITLLSLFTFSSTEMHQLLKLPVLFQHFTEHQAAGPMGWWHFMEEHYLHDRHDHAGDANHQELPFHCDHHCGAQTLQARIADDPASSVPLSNGVDVQVIPAVDHIPYREGPGGIWQPPRA